MPLHARPSIHPANCTSKQHAPLKFFWRGGQDSTSAPTERYDIIPRVDFCPSFQTLTTLSNRDRRLMPDMCLSGHPQLLFTGLKDILDNADRMFHHAPKSLDTDALRTLLWFLIDAEECSTSGPLMAHAEEIKIGSQEACETFYLPAWLIDQILEASTKAKRDARGPPPLPMPRLSSECGGRRHRCSSSADSRVTAPSVSKPPMSEASGNVLYPRSPTGSLWTPRRLSFASPTNHWSDVTTATTQRSSSYPNRYSVSYLDCLAGPVSRKGRPESRKSMPKLDLARSQTPTSEEVDRVMRFAESQLAHTSTSKAALLQNWARATSALNETRPHVDESPKASRCGTPTQPKEDSFVEDFEYLGFTPHGSPSISTASTIKSSVPETSEQSEGEESRTMW